MKLGTNSEKKLSAVHGDLVAVIRRAVELTPAHLDWGIVQGNRTQAEQDALYAQGRSKPGKVVTWTRNSNHIGGQAIDFAHYTGGKYSWDSIKAYQQIGAIIKKAALELGVSVVWGGDWKSKDWGHIELNRAQYPKGKKVSYLGKGGPAKIPAPQQPSLPLEPKQDHPARAVEIWTKDYFWTPEQACGMAGNAMQESYSDMRTHVVGDGGTAHQIMQWRGSRWNAFKSFARKYGKPELDFDIAVHFVPYEMTTTEKKAGALLTAAKTLEEAVDAGIAYLRPGTPHRAKRLKYAKDLYNRLYGGKIA